MTTAGPQPQRRAALRRPVALTCELLIDRWDAPVSYTVTDIGASGVWLATAEPLRLGTEVAATFTPPGADRPLYVAGYVRRVRTGEGPGMGIAFSGMRADDRRLLSQCLRGIDPPATGRVFGCTLTGVPYSPLWRDVEVVDPEAETLEGWPAPLATTGSQDDAFGGGLDLIASVFGYEAR